VLNGCKTFLVSFFERRPGWSYEAADYLDTRTTTSGDARPNQYTRWAPVFFLNMFLRLGAWESDLQR
jgi:hypothetical protein